jgi:FkbM family methyltransferase
MYRHPGATAAVRRALNSTFGLVAPKGPRVRRILAGPLRGRRMTIDLGTEEKRYWLNLYEPWVQDQLLRFARSGSSAWDVGAFVGYHTLLLDAAGVRIVAVEPDPANRQRLEANLELNGAAARVPVVPKAISSAPGTLYMVRANDEPAQNAVAETGEVAVEATTLDALLDEHGPPDLVKMDIEGAEVAAFAGGARVLGTVRPVFVMELHGEPGQAAHDQLLEAGYRIEVPYDRRTVAEVLEETQRAHAVAIPPR